VSWLRRYHRAVPVGALVGLLVLAPMLWRGGPATHAAAPPILGPSNGYSSLLVNHDGSLELFAQSSSGSAYHSYQASAGNWYRLGGPAGLQGTPAVGLNADGTAEAFAITVGGVLVSSAQASWATWAGLSSQSGLQFAGQPAVTKNSDGRLEVFARSTQGAYWHDWQSSPGGSWAGWFSLGGTMHSDPTVIQNADGRVEVFGVAGSTQPLHAWQGSAGWSGWTSMGGSVQGRLSLVRNQDGRLEAFGTGFDGVTYHAWQSSAGRGWTGWGGLGGYSVGNPAVIVNPSGFLEAFVRAGDGGTYHAWQNPGLSWTGWSSMGGYATGDPIATVKPDLTVSLWVSQGSSWFENDRMGAGWTWWQGRGVIPAVAAPPTNFSWYIHTGDTATAWRLGDNQGRSDAAQHASSEVILDFGGQQPNANDGTEMVGNVGALSTSQIAAIGEAFAMGYWDGTTRADNTTVLRLAIGTNNSFYSVTFGGGQIWSVLVAQIAGWVVAQGYGSQIVVVGANDIESWGDSPSTVAWVRGFNSEGGKFINFGSADGCPPAGSACNRGWTQQDYYYVSWGNPSAVAAPEIYYEANALQWQAISQWGALNGGTAISFEGPLDEGGTFSACSSGRQPFTATAAWGCLSSALGADGRTAVTMTYSDEIHYEP
jgi:hypothetical protein